MTSRREFLQTASVMAAVPLIARTPLADVAPSDRLVVFDRGFAAAERFGERAQGAGWSVTGIDSDVTAFWVGELSRRWSGCRPVPVAGLTAGPALFCLEQLAWDHQLRVVCHVEHVAQPNGQTLHSVRIPADGPEAPDITLAGEHWPEYMTDALTHLPVPGLDARGPSEVSMSLSDSGILHSWVIAPVLSRARSATRNTDSA